MIMSLRKVLSLTLFVLFLLIITYVQDFKVVPMNFISSLEASPRVPVVLTPDMIPHHPLDLNKDVLVLLRIARTGVTKLARHIIGNSDIRPRCENQHSVTNNSYIWTCRSRSNATWLVSPLTTGHIHPILGDYTTLTERLDETMSEQEPLRRTRRYHYVTMLREPLKRFRSELFHAKRSGWKQPMLSCNGEAIRQASLTCFRLLRRASDVNSFNAFATCPGNPAVNKQTRMLADLRLVNCYDQTAMTQAERNRKMLNSAKNTLLKMSFFGLTEYQRLSQRIFEKTFQMKFLSDFRQFSVTFGDMMAFPSNYSEMVTEINRLDIELYNFAKRLFMKKAKYFNLV